MLTCGHITLEGFFFSSSLAYFRGFVRVFIPRKKYDIKGEVCLITGAGNGIGRHLAVQMAKQSAVVICVDVKDEANVETAEMIKAAGGMAFA